jgi:hypothetical protein
VRNRLRIRRAAGRSVFRNGIAIKQAISDSLALVDGWVVVGGTVYNRRRSGVGVRHALDNDLELVEKEVTMIIGPFIELAPENVRAALQAPIHVEIVGRRRRLGNRTRGWVQRPERIGLLDGRSRRDLLRVEGYLKGGRVGLGKGAEGLRRGRQKRTAVRF